MRVAGANRAAILRPEERFCRGYGWCRDGNERTDKLYDAAEQ